MKRVDSDDSATPMSDQLVDRVDDYRRMHPHLSDEEHYAMAWRDLSPKERAQIRAEESGEYQQRIAEEARLRQSAMRKAIDMSKIDTGRLALFALACAAEELRKSNPSLTREQAFARVYSDPGFSDIAKAERTASRARFAERAAAVQYGDSIEKIEAVAKRDNALGELQELAADLRKAQPHLSAEQAFAKVMRLNPALAARERAASREALYSA
jgi:hypothetical protein